MISIIIYRTSSDSRRCLAGNIAFSFAAFWLNTLPQAYQSAVRGSPNGLLISFAKRPPIVFTDNRETNPEPRCVHGSGTSFSVERSRLSSKPRSHHCLGGNMHYCWSISRLRKLSECLKQHCIQRQQQCMITAAAPLGPELINRRKPLKPERTAQLPRTPRCAKLRTSCATTATPG